MRQQLSFLFAFSVFLCGKGRWELFRFLTNRGRTFGSSKVHRARQQESDPSPRWHVRCCDGRLRFFVLLYCVVASFDISHCRYCYVRSTRSTEKWPAAVVAFFLSSVLLTELTTDGRTDFLPQPLDRWNDDEGAERPRAHKPTGYYCAFRPRPRPRPVVVEQGRILPLLQASYRQLAQL